MTTRSGRSYERSPILYRSLSVGSHVETTSEFDNVRSRRDELTLGNMHPSQTDEGTTHLSSHHAAIDQGTMHLAASTVEESKGQTNLIPTQESNQGHTHLEPPNDSDCEGITHLSHEKSSITQGITYLHSNQQPDGSILPHGQSLVDKDELAVINNDTVNNSVPSEDTTLPRPINIENEEITDLHTDLREYTTPHIRKRATIV